MGLSVFYLCLTERRPWHDTKVALKVKREKRRNSFERSNIQTIKSRSWNHRTNETKRNEEMKTRSDKCFQCFPMWEKFVDDDDKSFPESRLFWKSSEMKFNLIICCLVSSVCSFNLEPRISILKQGPADTYFGFSVSQHQVRNLIKRFWNET